MIFLKVVLILRAVSINLIFTLLSMLHLCTSHNARKLTLVYQLHLLFFKIKQYDIWITHRQESFFTNVSLMHKLPLWISLPTLVFSGNRNILTKDVTGHNEFCGLWFNLPKFSSFSIPF